ncbi:MAG TPA: hypothetical protein VD704_12965 [Gaiellaceae bacterium]|nr:hypothetical protein [Gaiellaceae bacterium]
MRTVFLPCLGVLLLAACSSLESEPAAESPRPAVAGSRETAEPRWQGAKATQYRNAYRVCSVFTVEEIAAQHEAKARPRAAARAHARRLYEPRFRRVAFAGCLDGLRGEPPRA